MEDPTEPTAPEQPTGKPLRQIIITLTDKGLQFSGPLDDPILVYGMLEQAKDLIRMQWMQRQIQANAQQIVGATAIPPGLTLVGGRH